jgi:hypothetical protein
MSPAERLERRRARQRTPEFKVSKRNSRFKNLYGITLEEYEALLAKQGGHCALCSARAETNGWMLTVDHDHQTKRVRGVLCRKHNAALGALGDTAEALRLALAYLEAV